MLGSHSISKKNQCCIGITIIITADVQYNAVCYSVYYNWRGATRM